MTVGAQTALCDERQGGGRHVAGRPAHPARQAMGRTGLWAGASRRPAPTPIVLLHRLPGNPRPILQIPGPWFLLGVTCILVSVSMYAGTVQMPFVTSWTGACHKAVQVRWEGRRGQAPGLGASVGPCGRTRRCCCCCCCECLG